MTDRELGAESKKGYERRLRNGFLEAYLSGDRILDIGYRGGTAHAEPITEKAIGVDLDYPGYDGRRLPFEDGTQDAVFSSHCLEHIDDFENALKDWYRVTRTGGYIVIVVPHRDLYEKKRFLPSRFNGDHKRFYTPASLLAELEKCLPLGGYRVRHMADVDDGFDYLTDAATAASGTYEIELVVQKISVPSYIGALRSWPGPDEYARLWARLLRELRLLDCRGPREQVDRTSRFLEQLPVPPFLQIKHAVSEIESGNGGEIGGGSAGQSVLSNDLWLRSLLKRFVSRVTFSSKFYIERYDDIRQAVEASPNFDVNAHFIESGYFESRFGSPDSELTD